MMKSRYSKASNVDKYYKLITRGSPKVDIVIFFFSPIQTCEERSCSTLQHAPTGHIGLPYLVFS